MSTIRRVHSRGQVLVLACIVFLTCALMLMASFSVANAVHERTRIQSAADARAFSIATLEARGFNTVAFMNRAIAGAIVAEMGIHAWRALAEHNVNQLKAGREVFILIAVTELAQCPKFKIQHCIHAFKAFSISSKYGRKYNSEKNKLESKDNQFKEAVRGYSDLIKKIHDAQKDLLGRVKSEIGNNSLTLRDLLQKTAPQASGKEVKWTVKGLACAVEGDDDLEGECESPSWKSKGNVKSKDERRDIMESAAMAARTKWEVGTIFERAASHEGYLGDIPIGLPVYDPDNSMDIQGEGHFIMIGAKNQAKVSGNEVSAKSGGGFLLVNWKHGCFVGWCPWFVKEGKASNGPSDPYQGVCGDGGCFINFRLAEEGGETDWGQPATYGAITQDLRKRRSGAAAPWEINGTGEVKMPNGEGKLKYVSSGQGFALAKGKTYFHQLGQWSAPPNLFDPFWRAKLHPFVREEMASILGEIGDSYGQQLISGGQTAVEGDTK